MPNPYEPVYTPQQHALIGAGRRALVNLLNSVAFTAAYGDRSDFVAKYDGPRLIVGCPEDRFLLYNCRTVPFTTPAGDGIVPPALAHVVRCVPAILSGDDRQTYACSVPFSYYLAAEATAARAARRKHGAAVLLVLIIGFAVLWWWMTTAASVDTAAVDTRTGLLNSTLVNASSVNETVDNLPSPGLVELMPQPAPRTEL